MNDVESVLLSELEKRNDKSCLVARSMQDYLPALERIRQGRYIEPLPVGISSLRAHLNYFLGMLFMVTGYPQSGKGEFLRFLAAQWVRSEGGKVSMFIPEDDVPLYLWSLKKSFQYSDVFIDKNYRFLEIKDDAGMPTAEDILKEAESLTKKGFNYHIIDPMNWLTDNNALSIGYEKLRITLTDFKQFCKRTKSILGYVEHPNTPRPNKDGIFPKCNKYMVTGGLMHYKKVDALVILHREYQLSEIGTQVMSESDPIFCEIAKMKNQKYLGVPGTVELVFKDGHYY